MIIYGNNLLQYLRSTKLPKIFKKANNAILEDLMRKCNFSMNSISRSALKEHAAT